MRRVSKRRGFTLIELLAALMLSGLAILGGVMLVDQVTDSTSRIVRNGSIETHRANGMRVLRQLLLDARVTADSFDRFRGDERATELASLCQSPGGWLESCRAVIAIDWRNDTSVVTASLSTGERLELMRFVGQAELRYFDATAASPAWVKRWALSVTMPAAIGVVVATDTSIYPLGSSRD